MSMSVSINIRGLERIDLKRGVEPEHGEAAATVRVRDGEYLVWLTCWTHEGGYSQVTLNGSRQQFEHMAAAIIARLAEIDALYADEDRQIAEALA